MGFFEFLMNAIEFASQSFSNFIVTFLLISIVGLFTIAVITSLSKFRPLNINRGKNNQYKDPIVSNLSQSENEKAISIYDMLVQAYERHRDKKRGNPGNQ